MNKEHRGVWSVVLAAGDGNRLKELTTTSDGHTVPKQFCSLNRRECLMQLALQRAGVISPPDKVTTIVAARHRQWWRTPLQHLSSGNVIVQPANRGTAVGIALALLHIQKLDAEALVILLPADHYVEKEAVLAESLSKLAAHASSDVRSSSIFLLGAEPDSADDELGYIVPRTPIRAGNGVSDVREFIEKPVAGHAQELIRAGALWNMFIVAGALRAIIGLFEKTYNFLEPMRAASQGPAGSLARLYADLPVVDFSRDVLAHYPPNLKVMAVPPCGWTDLGTPKRVAAIVRNDSPDDISSCSANEAMYLDLARAAGAR